MTHHQADHVKQGLIVEHSRFLNWIQLALEMSAGSALYYKN
jgi:hypothetical protein